VYLIRCVLAYFTGTMAGKYKPEDVLKKLGIRLRELRLAKGEENYEKFAYKHDLNRAQVWRYENGEEMTVTSLVKMLNALDISLAEFFSEGFER
jgi:transcriptional regulator with XRE-family HTH domain